MDIESQYGEEDLGHVTHMPRQGARPNVIYKEPKASGKYKALEERLKVVKGFDALEMCLTLDVVIPYSSRYLTLKNTRVLPVLGTTCVCSAERWLHMQMMHYFQDSLSGASLD